MRQRDLESVPDSDPHGLLFGSLDERGDLDDIGAYEGNYGHDGPDGHYLLDGDDQRERPLRSPSRPPGSRVEALRKARRRRHRRVVGILAALLVVVVVVSAWLVGMPIYHYFNPQDYSGTGSGNVVVTVHANDGAAQIGGTLEHAGVVASERAFTDAAKNNSRSADIQPGSYRLHKRMSAKNALALLLDPSARVNTDVVVTEGATVVDVAKRLTAPPCTADSPSGTICGLGLPQSSVTKALRDVTALGLPTDFTVAGKAPTSVEGFLFPATYPFDETTSATDALQQMVSKFTDQARSTQFTAAAKALGLTPYQELIVASIAQSEAKYPADMAKVARVILNRIKVGKNLQIDATSAYAAKLKGLDPTKTIYSQTEGPYNTYNHPGLPPTPISSPGLEAMKAASNPTAGDWLYYVNADAAGHLFFTNSQTAFAKAAAKCKTNNWGCG